MESNGAYERIKEIDSNLKLLRSDLDGSIDGLTASIEKLTLSIESLNQSYSLVQRVLVFTLCIIALGKELFGLVKNIPM